MIFFCKLISVGVGGMEGWEGHPAPKKLSQGTSFLGGGEDQVGEGEGLGNGVVGDIWQFENDISRWKWKNIVDGDFARILPLFVITC